MPALDRFDQSQRQLFLSLKNELSMIERRSPKALRAYERAFLRALPARPLAVSKAVLRKSVASADIVLVGDFHPFSQSQKGFLRLMEDTAGRERTVALECIEQRRQPLLDSYAAGNITAEELREELDFDHHWPFPWQNYKEILEYARHRGFHLLALNSEETGAGSLGARDDLAATLLLEEYRRHPGRQIFVLFGELHLAPAHLPGKLARLGLAGSVLVVHQNEPTLYWRAPRTSRGQRAEVLRLRRREYCILNSVPWMRLRSYLDWLEGSSDSGEEDTDIAGSIHGLAALLAEALAIPIGKGEEVEPIGPDELPSFSSSGLKPEEKILFRHAREFQRTAYLPVRGALILPHLSTNALAEAASLWLWRKNAARPPKAAAAAGDRLVLQFFVGYLGSKILNPKRKCNEVPDMELFLSLKAGASAFKKTKRYVFRRALRILEARIGPEALRSRPPQLKGALEVEACRLAGYVLANRFFLSMLRKPAALKYAKKLFRSPQASEIWAIHQLEGVARLISDIKPQRKNAGF